MVEGGMHWSNARLNQRLNSNPPFCSFRLLSIACLHGH